MEEFNSADILEKQNRKKRLATLEVGLFEISFVLIIIIVLFGLLNYFNILSLSTLYPNTFGFLPHKAFNSTPLPNAQLANSPSPTPIQTHDVSAVSDIPEYTLTITDQKLLISYLNATHIWSKTFNQLARPITLTRINFHLANTEGNMKMFTNAQGKPLSSSTFKFQNSTLDLYIYLSPIALNSSENSDLYQQTAIASISNLSPSGSTPLPSERKAIPTNSSNNNSADGKLMFKVFKQYVSN
ncbi:MAG: hypothetical protein M1444_02480 [Patescibacteria group bacterium]|nr:hypothetical protein [Patescibacteria group bacterium]